MKYYSTIILAELFLMLFMPGLCITESYGDQSDPAHDCQASCADMDAESRHRCVETCINAKRRNQPARKNDVKERMAACEDACADYSGVDRIKCLRICLDMKREHGVIKRDALKKVNENPCEERCSVLSGVTKNKCLLRCKRELRFKKED